MCSQRAGTVIPARVTCALRRNSNLEIINSKLELKSRPISRDFMAKLTTTSYAVLSLLAAKPWNAAELVEYMQKSALRFFWPRAGSGVYAEPGKLVEKGLATSREERVRGRERAVYRITAKGRRELQKWLRTTGEPPRGVAAEGMVQFMALSEVDIEIARRHARSELLRAVENLEAVADSYRAVAERGAVVPGRIHLTAIGARAITGLVMHFAEAAAWQARQVATWSDTKLDDDKEAFAVEVFAENAAMAESAAKVARAALREFDDAVG